MSTLVESYDVGSMPFTGDFKKFSRGALLLSKSKGEGCVEYFESKVLECFLDKLRVGVENPNYPQFRDMNEMFLEMFRGVEKFHNRYIEAEPLSAGEVSIPEVQVIKDHAREIAESLGRSFSVKVCVTGPHTLSFSFLHRHAEIFTRIGRVLSRIVEGTIFNLKHGRVSILALDEPTLGLVDDPLVDYGSAGRENLRDAWEMVFRKAKSMGVVTAIHLHSTSNNLFWDVPSLDVVESHVDDFLYASRRTRELLESRDKFLKASICRTDFEALIKASFERKGVVMSPERLGEVWRSMRRGELDPVSFLEDSKRMEGRLRKIVETFGVERVTYAGPECG
ncbi:MAG: hypothetical protein ACTSUS_01205, partial [Candidatus Freyarchaeota archaeon]